MPIDPSSLSGKLLWLRAKDNAGADGSTLTTWTDQSGLGRHGAGSGTPTVDLTRKTPAGGRTVRTASGFFNLPDLLLTGIRSNNYGGGSESVLSMFDGSTASKWYVAQPTVWVEFAITPPAALTTYSLTSGNDSPARDPKNWTLYGSNDRATWTTLDSRTGETFATRGQVKTYPIVGAAAFRYYKLDVTANNGAGDFQLAELTIGTASGNIAIPQAAELWMVVKSDIASTFNGGWVLGCGGSSLEVRYPDGGPVRDGVNLRAGAQRKSFTPTLPIDGWRLYRVQTTPTTYQAWLDNTGQLSTSVTFSDYGYIGAARLGSGSISSSVFFTGNIAEVLVVDHALSGTEASDLIAYFNTEHGLTVPGGSSTPPVTGAVAGALPSLTGSAAGTITQPVTGTVVGTLPSLTGTATGMPVTTGASSGTLLALTGSAIGTVAGLTTGTVDGALPPLSGAVAGNVTGPTTGTVAGTLPALTGSVTDAISGAVTLPVCVKVETGPLSLLHIVALPGVDIPVALDLTSGDAQAVVPLPGVSVEIGCSLIARQSDVATPDPRRLASQWRYVVTDLANTPLGELVDIEHDAVEDGVGEPATMQFTIATDSDQYALIKPIERQCQVWDGDVLRLRGPILPGRPSDDGTLVTYTVHDPSWFWRDGRRVITRIPQKNLIYNGDFKQSLSWWRGHYDAGSKPAAGPTVRVVDEDFVNDSDGLNPIKALEIVGTESYTASELSSNAVFWPNLATFRPGGVAAIEAVANAMPTTAGLSVTVVGHTANDGTGNGLVLSKRRADAAAAIIKGKRPGAVITTKGVGFYDPKPGFPVDSQEQRRVVISYAATVTADAKQALMQTIEVTQPVEARYPLELTFAAMLKIVGAWSVEDANMMTLRAVAHRKDVPSAEPWDETLGQGSASISDTDPVGRWIPQTASVTIPADGRTYKVDLYLYAPAALARYTAVGLFPDEMLYFWGVDQALIFDGIMKHIQDPAFGHGNLGVLTRTPLTGIKRDREFSFRDLTPADTALDGLTAISRGIEWDTVCTPTTTTATTFYPRQGKTVDYVLAQGGNVARAVPANTRDVGSNVIAQAQGLGSYRAVAYARDSSRFGGTLIERVVTAEQDTPLDELGETAKAELQWAGSSTPAYWLDVDPEFIEDVLANVAKGDTVRLILDYPEPVDRLARIVRRQIHPDSLRLMAAFEEV